MKYTRKDILENSVLSDALEHVNSFKIAVNSSQNKGFNLEMLQEFYGKAAFLNAFVKQNLFGEYKHFEEYILKEIEVYFEMLEILHLTDFVMNVVSKEIAKAFFNGESK